GPGVRTEKDLWTARDPRAAERQPVRLTLGDRQAIHVRAETALEDGVAIDDEVMRGDGGSNGPRGSADEIDGILGGDVLEHDLEAGNAVDQGCQDALDEDSLAVEHVDLGVRRFAVDQERHA